MPLDSICLSALTDELSGRICGMKIDKVQQPERDLILLSLRGNGENLRLLLSAGVGTARVHLTSASYEQPQTPPMFCMLLRKHLQGGRISAVNQPEGERLIIISVDTFDDMGEAVRKSLIVEMMGRHSNFILVDGDGLITDCLRRVDSLMSEKRQVLPGMKYRLPPSQDKPLFFSVSPDQRKELWSSADPSKTADKWILDTFSGLSPLICREICYRVLKDISPRIGTLSTDESKNFLLAIESFADSVSCKEFTPTLLTENTVPREFSFMPIKQYENMYCTESCEDFSKLLEAYYTRRDKAERIKRRAADITKTVKNARDRIVRKLNTQHGELEKTTERETLRCYGDLITANMYRLKKGDRVLEADDFYDESCPAVQIELDTLKTPQQNAARYYKNYTKAKTAEVHLTEQIRKGESEAAYLESVLDEIERAEGENDLVEIRRELVDSGYIKKQLSGKKVKIKESQPMSFFSETGFEILVGRNNSQNDVLTLKTARKADIWLHTQKIHGSHVIIRTNGVEIDEGTLESAASLAAYYSQARDGTKVPIDYTQVRYVKKPSGALPGMVIYTDYKTILAEPKKSI